MDGVAAVVVADVWVNEYPLLHRHDDDNDACNNDDAFSNGDAGVAVKVE
jgi:hypothetical protein